ncbi:MAG: tripartite tricarboxylate transporter substrate binding protein, partial [Pseudomonas sp.]|nr:tripartite tricarboxylate transporter substrate binding protein [Pseudomonas sp.]
MNTARTRIALATACMAFAGHLLAADPTRPECIAPAKPG